MNLKIYQKKVLKNLSDYMHSVDQSKDLLSAWEKYWHDQDISVGSEGVPEYHNIIKGVPHICLKVPTGGGKTFIACSSIKRIFDEMKMPLEKERFVVWLVPSDSILSQTVKNLSDVNHPYRRKLDNDFSGRVAILTKNMLLDGQNFSPESIRGMLTICVLSYNSLRIDSKKKDIRKIYQENGNLMSFAQYFKNDDILLAETPETALIQIIRQLFPVTIVDESHNAGSVLSVEMLNNLNPSFVLDLTATPRKNSNIISYVDARELKKENMVKLPVIVFKRNTKESVIKDAIQLRESIDKQAVDSEKKGGDYIRPIVLFQAQPNINQESETFEKIKKTLIDIGIPSEQIAIKTSQIDDLKKVDLMSRECSVKYIITVNALKEGWDCPFAYILASLANKNSKVDIEQILGRILRQPYAKQHSTQMLNSSYVLTCSDDFQNTLESIVRGLNRSGFSRKDYRIGGNSEIDISTKINSKAEDEKLENIEAEDSAQEEPISSLDDDIFSVQEIIDMEDVAIQAIEDYESKNREESSQGYPGGELDNIVKKYKVQVQFADEIKEMRIPQFFFKIKPNQFANGNILVEPENLSAGFSLDKLDAQITFNTENNDMFVVDIQEEGEAVPKYKIANRKEATIHQYLEPLSKQEKKYKMY